ncbi:patatin-like phospholipase family protein [Roseimicrobium sp. ORNL1]|uniref:patatin-like phospholipase family protein n=1 Tax=Roseimicrobium sp. ORNL1 TaxID=2711231 RepID=UPI0013E18F1D|nr:patatin-like phospholipase family protein [Roseimicrobium sp. ORNL1]QIF00020.1 patatin-like phospholipase family protein [Roseimicrobium sp. ORNL1]
MPFRHAIIMKRIGLALSGGGFRASLYHLGLVRFLRDAGLLSRVTHIASVSGGSIFSAHLVLNWKRYCGTDEEFEEVAAEFLSFVRLNVRSRILRRFPLTFPLRWGRMLLGKSNRKLTRTGLLEHHYEKFLYGDVSLFELPQSPKLHLLTTNLSEGCLCSFSRDGLSMVRRQGGHTFRVDKIHTGLATVPMAVTASSAFPGFFPPLELTGSEVGVSGGEFGKQAYTDGGVYDNLGVRVFRFIERQMLADEELVREDFVDLRGALEALREASVSDADTPLQRLALLLEEAGKSGEDSPLNRFASALEEVLEKPELFDSSGSIIDTILTRLGTVMCHYQFQHEALFAGLKPDDAAAAELLLSSRTGGQSLDAGDQVWLNRHLLETAFRCATGKPCFQRLQSGFDCVMVSDVGRQIKVVKGNSGGLIRTALRASDILMDRVWQLENETFRGAGGFVFARITEVVEPEEDPTAPHPEIQRQAANIRTDLDHFTPLEISSLVRHGYCVARKICRSRPDVFGESLPDTPPWEPIPERRPVTDEARENANPVTPDRAPTEATNESRELQGSANRRVWSSFFDRRDWVTFVYVPILVPIVLLLPYLSLQYYKRMVRLNTLTLSFAQGSPDLARLGNLLDEGAQKPWTGVKVEETQDITVPDLHGYKILSDSRITDLRSWQPGEVGKADSRIYTYRRLLVMKLPENTDQHFFRERLILTGAEGQVRFPPQALEAKVQRAPLDEQGHYRWDAVFDFSKVPSGKPMELMVEVQSPGLFLYGSNAATGMTFAIEAQTSELLQWVLMPKGREYNKYRYIYYQRDHPETAKEGVFTTEYLAKDSTLLAFKILALEPGYDHEISWEYR